MLSQVPKMSGAITIHLHVAVHTSHTLDITPTSTENAYATCEPDEWSCLIVSSKQHHTIEDDTTKLLWV